MNKRLLVSLMLALAGSLMVHVSADGECDKDEVTFSLDPELSNCASGCAPFATNDELNTSYMNHFAWRFEEHDTKPLKSTAREVFAAYRQFAPGNRVLDCGAGPGHFAKWMQEEGAEVVCLDPFAAFASYCVEKGLPFIQGSLDTFITDARFDMAVGLCWPFNHMEKERVSAALENLATNILNPGGILITAIFMGIDGTYEDPMDVGHKRHFVHYTQPEWTQLLDAHGFELIATREHYLKSIKKDVRVFIARLR